MSLYRETSFSVPTKNRTFYLNTKDSRFKERTVFNDVHVHSGLGPSEAEYDGWHRTPCFRTPSTENSRRYCETVNDRMFIPFWGLSLMTLWKHFILLLVRQRSRQVIPIIMDEIFRRHSWLIPCMWVLFHELGDTWSVSGKLFSFVVFIFVFLPLPDASFVFYSMSLSTVCCYRSSSLVSVLYSVLRPLLKSRPNVISSRGWRSR